MTTLAKPIRSEAVYQGVYSALAFDVLGSPVPFYRNILNHLGEFGANLSTLSTDLATLSEASVTCYLQELGVFINFRLDKFNVTAQRLHEVSADIAEQLLRGAWAAVRDTAQSISIARHVITATAYTELAGTSYDGVIKNFVKLPKELGVSSQAGAIFYTKDNGIDGSVVLDRLLGVAQGMTIKLSVAFDGGQYPVEGIVNRAAEYLDRRLASLSLQLER